MCAINCSEPPALSRVLKVGGVGRPSMVDAHDALVKSAIQLGAYQVESLALGANADAAVTDFASILAFDSAEVTEGDHTPTEAPMCGAEITKFDHIFLYDPSQPRDADGRWTTGDQDRTKWPQHVQDLHIPPTWTDVRYSTDPKAALLAVAKDSKGREQYMYSAEHKASQAALKFERVLSMEHDIPLIDQQISVLRTSKDEGVAQHTEVSDLIRRTGIRPGSEDDTQAKVKAYGATTLEGRHVHVDDQGGVRLQFVGKKGVSIDIPVIDQKVSDSLRQRATQAGPGGQLFPRVSDGSLLNFVHGTLDHGGYKTKDFRTLLGTSSARDLVSQMKAPADQASYVRSVREVAQHVSRLLGNTPTVALQSYIAPQVFSPWRMNLNAS